MAGKGRGKRADEGRTNARRVITAFVLAAAFAACAVAVPVAVSPRAERAVVVVDAGHGGADGGVTGVNTGVKESDLNLAMSFLIGGCLEGMGFEVVYTRAGKGGLYDETDRDKKSADMHRRGEIIRASAPSAVLSVHMNIFFERGRRGAQVFFDRSSEGGRALAEGIQTALNEGFNLPDAGRAFAALSAERFILQQSATPSVIVECGFLSNPADEANLLDPDYTVRFAETVADSVHAFLAGGA